MSTFRCVVAIRTRKLFDKDIYYANVPGWDGMYGILAGHELLVGLNKLGGVCTITIDEAKKEKEEYLIYGGATQMFNGILTILGDFACKADAIDEAACIADKEEAERRISKLEADYDNLSKQDKARLRSYKHRLAWDNYQLDYLKAHK